MSTAKTFELRCTIKKCLKIESSLQNFTFHPADGQTDENIQSFKFIRQRVYHHHQQQQLHATDHYSPLCPSNRVETYAFGLL